MKGIRERDFDIDDVKDIDINNIINDSKDLKVTNQEKPKFELEIDCIVSSEIIHNDLKCIDEFVIFNIESEGRNIAKLKIRIGNEWINILNGGSGKAILSYFEYDEKDNK